MTLAAACAAVALAGAGAGHPAISDLVAGEERMHAVARGESLTVVAARHGVEVADLARDNGLAASAWLVPGQMLRVDARHIVPCGLEDGILVNVPQRMLFHLRDGRLVRAFPVGVGRRDWPTPTGRFFVAELAEHKTWIVPPSIRAEMCAEGRPPVAEVPPGPDNPLGRYWIGLSIPGYGIHSTPYPASVHRFASHGCIRAHTDDIATLFDDVAEGEPGLLLYEPVLLAATADGRVWLEVAPDAYRLAGSPWLAARHLAREAGVSGRIDERRLADVVRNRSGVARDVTLARTAGLP